MVKSTASDSLAVAAQRAQEARIEAERMHDVLILIDNLLRREEVTARLILDCLYEVGSVNLINQKVRSRPVNRLAKWIARSSKPVFAMIAIRWFKKNCPRLIVNWLHSQVKFGSGSTEVVVSEVPPTEVNTLPASALPALEGSKQEIVRLQSQVKVLTATLVGVSVTLSGTLVWVMGWLG
ncbi:MAG: hypothetical protein KME16_22530 [Scytolyngbya sp. HA4215-MV1]|jgi:hypothetical protein|nr:hypothetical protein [Scytolyngbya sp. HA4215-MV1]